MTSSVLVGFKPTYHGIVLAAGRNTRLAGVIPSYHKPLMVVNGRPLVVNIVRELRRFCSTVTVVISPENAGVISEVLDANELLRGDVNLVLQPRARGPGEAVLRGMRAAQGENRTVIVCADNIIPRADFDEARLVDGDAYLSDPECVVTVTTTVTSDKQQALRFTRVIDDSFIEGIPGGDNANGYYACWVGPLIVPTVSAEQAYTRELMKPCGSGDEMKVSGPLNSIPGLVILQAAGNSVDIGTSDALFQVNKESA